MKAKAIDKQGWEGKTETDENGRMAVQTDDKTLKAVTATHEEVAENPEISMPNLDKKIEKSENKIEQQEKEQTQQQDHGRVDGDAQKELGKEIEKDISGGMGMGM